MKEKLAGLGEFAKARAEREQLLARNNRRLSHHALAHVVNAVFVKAKAIRFVVAFDQISNVFADAENKK
jgi:hypothetical protein